MARLTTRSANRGQLLLVGALALGVVLILLALILSTAIHTETLAEHGSDSMHEERTVVSLQESTYRGVAGIITIGNSADNSTHETLAEDLSADIAEWNEIAARHTAGDGAATNVSLVSVTTGTHIGQDDDSRDFTNRSGASDWTVVESVSNVREFRMNVTDDALFEPETGTCVESGDCFTAEVANGSETWDLYVYSNASENDTVSVQVVTPSGDSDVCNVERESEFVAIDVTGGTLAGEDCPQLSFAENLTAPYDVGYANADNIAGSYELTVDEELSTDPHFGTDGAPSVAPAIYAATVSVSYLSPDLTYETEIRVAPGESDA